MYRSSELNQISPRLEDNSYGEIGTEQGQTPSYFTFFGNSVSLQTRLEKMNNELFQNYVDANITVSGTEIQTFSKCCFSCSHAVGAVFVLPLFIMLFDCWKKCTYQAWSISSNAYLSLGRLFRCPNLKNLSLIVVDNTFDKEKAQILYNFISKSRLRRFTFVNGCGNYNFNGSEWSDFQENMRPIQQLSHINCEIRWGNQIVQP